MAIDDKLKDEMLRSISISGVASEENRTVSIILASKSQTATILDSSSGLPKIRNNFKDKFHLVLSQPLVLTGFNPFEIRCVLCKRIISYPAWYLCLRYAVNEFHYFVCFDPNSAEKPSTRCFRR